MKDGDVMMRLMKRFYQPHPVNQRYLDQQMWKLNGLAERLEGFEGRLENHREMLEHGRD